MIGWTWVNNNNNNNNNHNHNHNHSHSHNHNQQANDTVDMDWFFHVHRKIGEISGGGAFYSYRYSKKNPTNASHPHLCKGKLERLYRGHYTVDGRNPASVDMVVSPIIYGSFIHPRWCRISTINSITDPNNALFKGI